MSDISSRCSSSVSSSLFVAEFQPLSLSETGETGDLASSAQAVFVNNTNEINKYRIPLDIASPQCIFAIAKHSQFY